MPEREAEDILAGIIRLRLGDRMIAMPVLPIGPAKAWKEQTNVAFGGLMAAVEAPNANAETILAFLSGQTDMQLDLLYAYDAKDALPDREWIEANATDAELLTALLGVLAAAFPLAATVIAILRTSPDLQTVFKLAFSGSTSFALPPTAGNQPTLSPN